MINKKIRECLSLQNLFHLRIAQIFQASPYLLPESVRELGSQAYKALEELETLLEECEA